MKHIKLFFISSLAFIVSFSSVMTANNPTANAASRTFSLPESTSQTQTHTITLPNLKSINSIASNRGTATIQSISGDQVTVRVSGGSASRSVQTGGEAGDSRFVTNQTSSYYNSGGYSGSLSSYLVSGSAPLSTVVSDSRVSSSNSFSSTIYYSSGGYAGTLSKSGSPSSRLVSGTAGDSIFVTDQPSASYNSGGYSGVLTRYQAGGTVVNDTKTASEVRKYPYVMNQGWPDTIQYNSGGYTGTLSWTMATNGGGYVGGEWVEYYEWVVGYSGTVTGTLDTRFYRYQGTVTKPDTRVYEYTQYYSGTVSTADTRVYRYEGTVYKPDTRTYQNYYQYNLTVDYIDNTAPVLAVTNTSQTVSANNGYNTITLQGTVRDVDNNPVTISGSINGKNKSTIVSSTSTTKNWTLSWNVSSDNIAEGVYSNITLLANDGEGGVTNSIYTGSILVDRTNPTITFTPESIEPTFKDLEVQTNITDVGGSAYKQSRYAWTKDTTRPTEGWSEWDVSTNPLITQEKGGKWFLHIEAQDHAGNIGYATSGIYEKIVVSGGPSININVFPTPTGIWLNQPIDVYVMDSGDTEMLSKSKKTFEVTNSPLYPNTLSKTLPADKKIQLNLQGENFVHVQYILDDGTKISATAGPYFIDTGAVGDFDMKLVNAAGVEVTNWTNQNLRLLLNNPTGSSVSGLKKQYRIEGVHTDWQPYTEGLTVSLEGNYRVFGRILNGTGASSPQKNFVAKIDQTKPTLTQLKLVKDINGTYHVSAKADDALSGMHSVQLNNGTELTSKNNAFELSGLTTKPIHVSLQDQAGNILSNVSFAVEPLIAFEAPYTLALEVYKENVIANLSNVTGYLIGSRGFACATESSCQLTIPANTTLTAVRAEGVKETRSAVKIENIDKTNVQLLLNGKRNATTPLKIEFTWNRTLSNGTLSCIEDGNAVNYTVSGTSYVLNGKNYTYHCTLTGTYKGQTLTSNTVVIYADGKIPAEGTNTVPTGKVTTNVYIMETKLGKGYIINAKSDNYKYNELPLPMNEITKD